MTTRLKCVWGGRELVFETGKVAKQADGSVTVQYGGSMVLSTVVVAPEPKAEVDFLPLTCEYQEKTYSAGKIPGGFFKREGRPSEKATLSSRLIDRPIRPLFPKGWANEVQVVSLVLSADGENDTDVLAMIGSFCALGLSSIPLKQQLAAVRVGLIDGQYVLNPTFKQLETSRLNVVLAASRDRVMMVEAGAREASEEETLAAIDFGQKAIREIIDLAEELVTKAGKPKKEYPLLKTPDGLEEKVRGLATERIDALNRNASGKNSREEEMTALRKSLIDELVVDEGPVSETHVKSALAAVEKELVNRMILREKRRADGRSPKTIRPITCEVGLLPRAHGSSLFTRGQTQSLAATTLGGSDDEQTVDAIEGESYKRFMLHYNFPSFSVGEVRPIRGPGRREIGHGALAERALAPVMPPELEFPYVVRLVSDILESNGSSSMATVCAGSLALMDAGVPIKAAVSGIAMGLVMNEAAHVVLTDIAGLEDHLGDMDFKVAGTEQGITALQMDIKIGGVTQDVLKEVFGQAREARLEILQAMNGVLSKARAELSPLAPRIVQLTIDPEKIGAVIGPGGKMIRRISEETGCEINIEDSGVVQVLSTDADASVKAVDWIKSIVAEPEIGMVYEGRVSRMMKFGAFAEFMHGKEGLIHVSELAENRVERPEDVVRVGDAVKVKVIEIDEQGRINLSRKQAMTPEELKQDTQARAQAGPRPPMPPQRDSFRGRPHRRDERPRGRDFGRGRDQDRGRDQGRGQGQDRGSDQDRGRDQDRGSDQDRGRDQDQGQDPNREGGEGPPRRDHDRRPFRDRDSGFRGRRY
ncbi:MAG: polyribonucleotide nucleotidyltransferase [Candidatus Omnitrophica bacterium]|nr:polyribonucleotide nucleotidyltransferase [Candidatus Omnitrophota bacterium]